MDDIEWLFKKENYIPMKDNDSFINKTIMHFIGLLGKIKKEKVVENGFLYNINPMLKLVSTIILIILLSISKESTYIYVIGTYFLVQLATIDGKLVKKIFLLSISIPIFTFIMLIPSMIMGNIHNNLMIILKIAITLIGINILSNTTAWHDITKTFKLLFISDLFILVFDITIRYIYLLGEFSLQMLYALKLRSVGKNKNKLKDITSIIGNLFFKTKTMGEDMYSAMECRGFTGEYVSYKKLKLIFIDYIYLIVTISLIIIFFAF